MKFRYLELSSENINFGLYFAENRHFQVSHVVLRSCLCHTLTDFYDFGINGKRRPYPILWYQTTILWTCQFQVHRGLLLLLLLFVVGFFFLFLFFIDLIDTIFIHISLRSGNFCRRNLFEIYLFLIRFWGNRFFKVWFKILVEDSDIIYWGLQAVKLLHSRSRTCHNPLAIQCRDVFQISETTQLRTYKSIIKHVVPGLLSSWK